MSVYAKLTRSILMSDRNIATEPNYRKLLSKSSILSLEKSYLLILAL